MDLTRGLGWGFEWLAEDWKEKDFERNWTEERGRLEKEGAVREAERPEQSWLDFAFVVGSYNSLFIIKIKI